MKYRFEWDENKAMMNLRKHGVSFPEAIKVFDNPSAVEQFDDAHSTEHEQRFWRLGLANMKLIYVVFTAIEETIRIIHARTADKRMERMYEREKGKD